MPLSEWIFVKIVQRPTVRVGLLDDNLPDTPLLAGLSVEPTIFIHEKPEGPHAGHRLRVNVPAVSADKH